MNFDCDLEMYLHIYIFWQFIISAQFLCTTIYVIFSLLTAAFTPGRISSHHTWCATHTLYFEAWMCSSNDLYLFINIMRMSASKSIWYAYTWQYIGIYAVNITGCVYNCFSKKYIIHWSLYNYNCPICMDEICKN